MFVGYSTCTTISFPNSKTEEALAQTWPHIHKTSITTRFFSDQLARFDVPIPPSPSRSRKTLIKNAAPLARVEVIRLSLLDASLRPIGRRRYPFRLAEEDRC